LLPEQQEHQRGVSLDNSVAEQHCRTVLLNRTPTSMSLDNRPTRLLLEQQEHQRRVSLGNSVAEQHCQTPTSMSLDN
jgi:hypothetical protein